MKGSITGSCGHEFKDDEKGNELTIKENDREGNKCIAYVYVCDECASEYEQVNIVLHNTKEENDYVYGEGTVEYIIKTMKDRGYSVSSHAASHFFYSFVKHIPNVEDPECIILHASVNVQFVDSTVELSFCGLKMGMTIDTGRIAFDHHDFERHEKILLHYANICNNNNPFDIGL